MSEDNFKRNRNISQQYAEGGSQQTQSGQIVDTAEIMSKMVTQLVATSEVVTIGATGAGTTVLSYAPIMTSDGDRVAYFGDTSLSFTSILTTEIVWDEAYRSSQATLSAGEWACDYDTGFVAYNAGSTGSPTANYTIRKLNTAGSSAAIGDVAHDAVDSGNPVKIGGYATDPTSMPTAVASGDRVNTTNDLQGRIITYEGVLHAGEDLTNNVQKVEGQFSYASISTATTTTVKSGAGHLRSLIVAGGTLGNITVYDNTAASGTVIQAAATPSASGLLLQDIDFGTGLTIVTAAATVINVAYR